MVKQQDEAERRATLQDDSDLLDEDLADNCLVLIEGDFPDPHKFDFTGFCPLDDTTELMRESKRNREQACWWALLPAYRDPGGRWFTVTQSPVEVHNDPGLYETVGQFYLRGNASLTINWHLTKSRR